VLAWGVVLCEQRSGRHDLTRLAVAALPDIDINPRLLQPSADRHAPDAFDCRYYGFADIRNWYRACADRRAVEMDDTGPAQTHSTVEFCTLQINFIAQHP